MEGKALTGVLHPRQKHPEILDRRPDKTTEIKLKGRGAPKSEKLRKSEYIPTEHAETMGREFRYTVVNRGKSPATRRELVVQTFIVGSIETQCV